MKRIVSLVLAISMVLSMFVTALAASKTFDDIKDTKYASAVEALVELGVIDGLPDGTYGPEKEVTRAQLAKMLVICLGLGDTVEALEGRTVFTDVADSHWASGYINAAVQSKVIAGYPDGTFKPEKNVSYAEAVTMVIRALGYGNVVDTEGTWPTAYMLKAVELELLDDMGSPKSGNPALRGNVAILLWNMLRTQMWKITSENEGTGMTSGPSSVMLNVKFPDYLYVEDAYLSSVVVSDDDVRATVSNKAGTALATAAIEDMDLPRLLVGMKVSSLVKDYKKPEEAKFLTLTPEFTLVEGVVTDVTSTKVEIDEVEYRLDNAEVEINDYVVVEVDGKKVTEYRDNPVLKVLPKEATEVEKIKTMESRIDEDALVIIDGEWATRDDIELGDMYTYLPEFGGYYMVARERLEGAFESYTYENDGDEYVYVEIDGEAYRAFESILKAWEDEDNDTEIDPISKLAQKEKDNKYLDQDVEVALNYLGHIVNMFFGEVSELEAQGDFYAMMSDGTWYTSSASGKQYHVVLAGADGEEETYDIATAAAGRAFENGIYASGDPVFVFAKFNDDNEVKSLEVVAPTASGETLGKYAVEAFSGEISDDNYLTITTGESKVTSSTVVMTVTPVEDEDEVVIGFEIEVSTGAEALEGVEAGLVAYDAEKGTKRAAFVFVAEDAKSQDLNFGLVEKVRQNRGYIYATISGTEYQVETDEFEDNGWSFERIWNYVRGHVDEIVAFTEDDDKITIKARYATTDLQDVIVTEIDDEFVSFDTTFTVGTPAVTVPTTADLTRETYTDAFEDITFVRAAAYANAENEVIFESDVEELGEGLAAISFKKGDRLVLDLANEVILVVDGFEADDTISGGMLVIPTENTPAASGSVSGNSGNVSGSSN